LAEATAETGPEDEEGKKEQAISSRNMVHSYRTAGRGIEGHAIKG
jgi:hypothetical protein